MALPPQLFRAGTLENPTSNLRHETGPLCERDKHRRHHQSPGWMNPADEGFDAGDPPVAGIDDRLVRHPQFPARRCAAEVVLQGVPLNRQMLFAKVDDVVPGAPLALRLVHRSIRVPEDILGQLVARSREGDPDTGGDIHLGPAQEDRCRNRGADARGNEVHLCRFIEVVAQDHELVARHAGQGVSRTQDCAEPLGDPHQQLVADGVAVEVVDRLEPVEVGEEDRRHLARPPASKHRMLQPLQKEDPVGQAGQRVVHGALTRPLGGVPQVGAVLRIEHIRGSDVGERLRRVHGGGVQQPGRVPVQIEGPQAFGTIAQREREHGRKARFDRPGRELQESGVVAEVGDRDGSPGLVDLMARALAEFGLHRLEAQRRLVRCRHVAGIRAGGDEGHPCGGDGQDVDEALHQVIEDALDR